MTTMFLKENVETKAAKEDTEEFVDTGRGYYKGVKSKALMQILAFFSSETSNITSPVLGGYYKGVK